MTLDTFGTDARIRAYRNNINRYRQLLASELTDLERSFIQRRLSEDRRALDALTRLGTATVRACASHATAESADQPAV
jgi:hypothetical protein